MIKIKPSDKRFKKLEMEQRVIVNYLAKFKEAAIKDFVEPKLSKKQRLQDSMETTPRATNKSSKINRS